jgi:uncharacterized protein DUF6457
MEDWIDRLAAAFGEDPLTEEEIGRLLRASRDVAHRVERKTTPLAAFLLGSAVGRNMAGGAAREEALPAALRALEAQLPRAAEEPPA